MSGGGLAEAFMANRAALLRYLRGRGAGDEAEDLLQDLWLKLDGHTEIGFVDARAYLYRMAHNLMLDRQRGSIRRRRREDAYYSDAGGGGAGDAPGAERTLLGRETLRRVEAVLSALGPRTDLIFRRYRIEGISQRDIAGELGITLSAVEKQLQKAYRAVASVQEMLLGEDAACAPEASDEPR